MSYIYDLTDTWNAAGTVFTSIKMNVTNSASANGSKLIDLQIGGTTLFNVDKSGNVGINIAAPSYRLHAVDTSGTIAGFRASTANIAQVLVGNTAGDLTMRTQSTGDGFIYSDTSKYLAFGTSATERMRITTAGDVGIGTTTPVARLEVNGTQRITKAGAGFEPAMLSFSTLTETGAIYRIGMGTAGSFTIGRSDTSTTDITLSQQGNLGIGTTTPTARLHSYSAVGGSVLRLQTGTNANGVFADFRNDSAVRIGLVGFVDATNLYVHNDSAGAILFDTNNLERMRITAAGDVGIGTATPAAKLDIADSAAASLRLNTTVSGNAQIIVNATGGTAILDLQTGAGVNRITGGLGGTSNLAFFTASTERARITAAGDVGIGTSSPTAKLDVNGQLNVPDQLAYDFTTSVLPDIAPTLNLNFVGANAVDPRITFTRSTTATYYDAETTAKAEENLFTYSQEFDNGVWSKANTNVTANSIAAPDGTLTADTLTAGAGAGAGQQVFQALTTIGAGSFVYSVYAKQGSGATDLNTFGVYNNTTATSYVAITVNYSTGVVTQTAGSGATMTDVGGGWWRIVMPFTSTATLGNSIRFFVSGSGAVDTPGEFMYAWGAQLEQRSVVTAYTATTASPITNYIPQLMTAAINQPRLDFDPVTRAPKGFLIEEARTNLLTYSSEIDNAAWTKTNASITANAVTSPDGTINADKIIPTTANADHLVRQTVTVTNATHTYTVCAKADGYGFLAIQIASDAFYTKYFEGVFNLTTGAVEGTGRNVTYTGSRSITSLGNGWYRCQIVVNNIDANSTTIATALPLSTNNPAATYAGNGFSGTFIWGAQLEAGSFATSYIPTVATSVVRGVDNAVMTGTNFSSWYNQGAGTITTEASAIAFPIGTGNNAIAAISDGTFNNSQFVYSYNNVTYAATVVGNVVQTNPTSASGLLANTVYKMAYAYATNDFAFSTNGASVGTDTSGSLPVVNQLQLGRVGTSNQLNGHIRSIRYYPSRLSNATLQALTA